MSDQLFSGVMPDFCKTNTNISINYQSVSIASWTVVKVNISM